jgi:hypothetical protein
VAWVLGLLALLPAFVALHHRGFEKRRWQDSAFSPYASGDDE